MKKSEFRLLLMRVRLEKSKTQESLAKDLGISQKSVSMWENGESVPRGPMRVKLAQVLELPLDYFMKIEDEEPKDGQDVGAPKGEKKKSLAERERTQRTLDELFDTLDDEGFEMLITKLKTYRNVDCGQVNRK